MIFGIVGLGIMGGSIAKAIRSNIANKLSGGLSDVKIYALDKNNDSLFAALNEGIIDKSFSPAQTKEMLGLCDFVFICLYPNATLDFLKEYKSDFKDGSTVTDISGVKQNLSKNYEKICPSNAYLILAHPMAGGEKEGFAASKSEYFKNHNYIIIKKHASILSKPISYQNGYDDAEKQFETIIKMMGFSRITKTDSDTHDDKIGFTSQLCHVVASAMVESAGDSAITSFGGGSFEDLTRIAMINAPLWTELFLSNKEKLLKHIDTFKNHLDDIEKLIACNDAKGLESYLQDVRNKRIEMQRN